MRAEGGPVALDGLGEMVADKDGRVQCLRKVLEPSRFIGRRPGGGKLNPLFDADTAETKLNGVLAVLRM